MAKKTRGKLFIDSKVQGALAKRLVIHWLVFLGMAIVTMLTMQYFMGDPTLAFSEQLRALWNQHALFIILLIALLPSFIYDTVRLSNRFAGPIVRLKRGIKELADGEEVAEMNFRDGDFWVDLSSEFNRLKSRVKELEQKKTEKQSV